MTARSDHDSKVWSWQQGLIIRATSDHDSKVWSWKQRLIMTARSDHESNIWSWQQGLIMTTRSDHDSKAGAPNEWLLGKEMCCTGISKCVYLYIPTASTKVTPCLSCPWCGHWSALKLNHFMWSHHSAFPLPFLSALGGGGEHWYYTTHTSSLFNLHSTFTVISILVIDRKITETVCVYDWQL